MFRSRHSFFNANLPIVLYVSCPGANAAVGLLLYTITRESCVIVAVVW